MNKKFSIPISDVEVADLGNNFLKLKIYAVSDGENRNKSNFLLESMDKSIPSFYNKPILAYYNPSKNDVEEHNQRLAIDKSGVVFEDFQYEGGEKPVGMIPESANIYIETIKDKNWIVIDGGIIWSDYSKQLSDLIVSQKQKKVSVEVEFLDSYTENNVEMVRHFRFLGITILGDVFDTGIADAHLTLADVADTDRFKKYKKALSFALKKEDADVLSKYGLKEEYKLGTKESIKINKSKDDVSNDDWGNVDKTNLRNKVLDAKNYKTLIKDVYLKIESGWEDAPSEKLKYPVMQIKGNEAVYNSNGLLSAQRFGEQHDESVAKKAFQIRKNLGLIESDKEAKMQVFIESAKTQKMLFIGLYDNKLRFVEEFETDKEVEKAEMTVFEIEKEKCGEEFKKEECEEIKMVKFEDDDDEDEDDIKEKGDDSETEEDEDTVEKEDEKATYEQKIREAEEEKSTMAQELHAIKEELSLMKKEDFLNKMSALFEGESDEEMKSKFEKDVEDGKFAKFEDLEKEYAYAKFLKSEEKKEQNKKFKFNTNAVKFKQNDVEVDRLDSI